MRPHLAELSSVADTLVCAYPNAGLPNEFGQYDESPEEMAAQVAEFAREGLVNVVGGCCGSTPAHIAAIARAVEGLPPELTVRVQTGPALNGTDLRDATGQIEFGQFRNQIEYQDAGSAINNEVKTAVLGGIDPASLSGKTVSVIGVFKLVNPKNWVVTPVRFDVK
jgi:predicted lipoprotein